MKPNATNRAIAGVLREIGEYLAMQEIPFKPRAYENAALAIDELGEAAAEVYARGGAKALREIPGVGASIAGAIEEYLTTGKVKAYDELKKRTPVDLAELSRIEGLGPKSIRKLYRELGVRNLKDLEAAAKEGKIAKLEGFGAKSEEKILRGIAFARRSGGRFVLGAAMPLIREIEAELASVKGVRKVAVAGSARRRRDTIGDADFLVIAADPYPVMERFVNLPEVASVIARGGTKSSVKLRTGMNLDVRVVPEESYGAALNYFTGSKDHNVALRKIAVAKGWKLNEYGLFRLGRGAKGAEGGAMRETRIAGKTEEELYAKFGMDYIEPELRENTGEIEAARAHHLPKLVGYGSLKGDLQTQTTWTDGADTIEAMALAAAKRGLEYIVITDHTKRLAMAHGLDARRLAAQGAEIDRVQKKFSGKIRILKGSECDILKDGTLDLPDEALAKLDVVGASVHSYFNLTRAEQTARVKKAMENPHVDILFHPTGRILNRREAYDIDMEEIVAHARRTKTVLEIDAFPDRADLKDDHIRLCVEAGVRMSIDSDAHAAAHFDYLEYGIAQARRGWAEKKDIVNAWPAEKMLQLLK